MTQPIMTSAQVNCDVESPGRWNFVNWHCDLLTCQLPHAGRHISQMQHASATAAWISCVVADLQWVQSCDRQEVIEMLLGKRSWVKQHVKSRSTLLLANITDGMMPGPEAHQRLQGHD
jgi:hypothetical protein